jgi:predicted nucleotidyltransferase
VDLDDLLRRAAAALEPLDVVRVAWLFGSQATGRAGARSDLDVAVVHRRDLDDPAREQARRQIVAALTDALGRLGERADVVDIDRTGSAVAFRAIRDGRRLVARTESERVAAEVRVMRRYDDDAPRRALFRKAAQHHAVTRAKGEA